MMSDVVGPKQFRSFGLLVGGIFGTIGLWPMVWRQQDPRWWAVALAAVLIVPALVAPRSLALIYRAWMTLGEGLSWINTRIILGVVFYALVTPMGLTMRLFGRDPMRRGTNGGAESLRMPCTPRPASHMLRQF